MSELTCFKAYDIRGRLGMDLDENIAAAFAVALEAKRSFWDVMSVPHLKSSQTALHRG